MGAVYDAILRFSEDIFIVFWKRGPLNLKLAVSMTDLFVLCVPKIK